jgi:hypothetical protein
MTLVVLTAAADLRGQDSLDLEFRIRDHNAAQKWAQCLRSVEHRAPWKWGYTASADDLGRIEQRIKHAILNSELRNTYLRDFVINDNITVSQDVVNTVHRFVEDHKAQAAWHLQLHNDIHYWEGIKKGDASPSWRKIMWNPPGTYIDFSPEDYLLYDTESCDNFLMQDFAHVGRDPFNSYTFRDDLKLESSCVIQHAVTSGFKWVIRDDSTNYTDHETEFRQWVSDHMWYFQQAGVQNQYDPRLCFGRMILADGCEDYTQLDPRYKFILKVRVSE